MSRVLGVIPARLASTRLPEKPLRLLYGVPLIVWVWDRARRITALERVVVATDAEAIRDECRAWGAEVVMTATDHPSGTDRVQEVARGVDPSFEIVVNVQGDEPLIDSGHVERAIALVREGYDVGTCASPIRSSAEFQDPAVVKVVRRTDGSALYFSRAAIPHRRDSGSDGDGADPAIRLRHVGIYAYTRSALARWVGLAPSPLEQEERLEQLRALEDGLRIGVAVVAPGEHGGVDTPEDLARVAAIIQARGIRPPVRQPRGADSGDRVVGT